eukprot:scaffold10482_cov56-Attheya_sp.AAC.2
MAGWVDPDTPKGFHRTKALTDIDKRQYKLVFSDEFEQEGRSFADGEDPKWTAINKNDYTNDALHFYSSDNARVTNGVMNITTEEKVNEYRAFNEKTKKFYADKKHIQSGMLQGWNKFCLTGGIVEFRAKLPGDSGTGGLWPALWMLGNLARATYVGSSDFMWPYSYNQCNEETRMSQEINACSKVNHYGMDDGVGRGSPEIDILEGMGGEAGKLPNTHIERPYFSASLQIAPGIRNSRPQLGHLPQKGHWYTHLEYGPVTNASINPFFYGVTLVHKPKEYTYQSDAISANMHISEDYYKNHHIYRVEWEPSDLDGSGGYIKWFADGELVSAIYADSLAISGAQIPNEPMYILMNTAVASSWGFPAPCPEGCDCECYECGNPDCACALPQGYCDNFPANFEVDYVRVWQAVNETKHTLGCSTKDRPSELFIKGHSKRYMGEDDKVPLQPVQQGGAPCSTSEDCGGVSHGGCTNGKCKCLEAFVGSRCLAHDGYDDDPFLESVETFDFDTLYLPTGVLVFMSILFVGFCLFMACSVIRKRKEEACFELESSRRGSTQNYDDDVPINMSVALAHQGISGPGQIEVPQTGSYAKQPSTENQPLLATSAQEHKVVTYCMIDGRLVDK